MWLRKVEFIMAQIDTGPVYPSTKTKLLSWICLICYRHVWTSIWYRNCLRSDLDPSSQAIVCQGMKSAQGMNQKSLRRQRAPVEMVKHPYTLPAHRLKKQLQTGSAFANERKRIRVKNQAVPKRATQVTKKRVKRPDPRYVVLVSWPTWARSFGGSSLKPGSILLHRALVRIYWIQLPVVSRSRWRCLEMVTITGQGGCNGVVCI